mgnify:CR=1 FL=1
MLRNYLLIALRHLSRERLYSMINVLGLSLGIGCCLLIVLLLRHESSFDQSGQHQPQQWQPQRVSDLRADPALALCGRHGGAALFGHPARWGQVCV